jgi:uncharacterized membrane protein YphA (DoxX/SURF4 family)
MSRWQPWASTVARLVLAGVLFAAGILKAVDPVQSVAAVNAYELVPPAVAKIIGYGLPFLEIGLALLLLIGFATRLAAIAAGVLMVIFIGGVISAWARGLSIDCGCFGGGGQIEPEQTQYVQEIVRDVGYLVLAGWLTVFPRSRFALDRFDRSDDQTLSCPTVRRQPKTTQQRAWRNTRDDRIQQGRPEARHVA